MKVDTKSPMYPFAVAFRQAYEFTERHLETTETGNFDRACKELSTLSSPLHQDLTIAVLKELNRRYENQNE